MKYYLLKYSDRKGKQFGVIEQREIGYDWESNYSQGKLKHNAFPDFKVNFSKLMLEKGSSAVDFINHSGSYGGLGYIVSKKAKEVLSNYNLQTHRFHELPMFEFKGCEYKYFWLQILVNSFDFTYVDFNKSTFYLSDFFGENKICKKFSNSTEFEKYIREMDKLKEKMVPKNITLNSYFNSSKLNLFYLDKMFHPFIVDERLKNALEHANLTGVLFKEIDVESSLSSTNL